MKTIAFITYYVVITLLQFIAIMIASSSISLIYWDMAAFLWLYDYSAILIRGTLTFSFLLTVRAFLKDLKEINKMINK